MIVDSTEGSVCMVVGGAGVGEAAVLVVVVVAGVFCRDIREPGRDKGVGGGGAWKVGDDEVGAGDDDDVIASEDTVVILSEVSSTDFTSISLVSSQSTSILVSLDSCWTFIASESDGVEPTGLVATGLKEGAMAVATAGLVVVVTGLAMVAAGLEFEVEATGLADEATAVVAMGLVAAGAEVTSSFMRLPHSCSMSSAVT